MYDLFSDFFNGFEILPKEKIYTQEVKCPVCKRTYSEFRKTGKLGCGTCYEAFRTPLTSIMRQIHPNTTYHGKIPSKMSSQIKIKRHYEQLKKQLSEAVKKEDYELAAKLHKEIREIEANNN